MRPSNNKSRSRNKPGNNNQRRNNMGNIVNRVFDSAGPDGKVRGTPQQIIDKYQVLARDAQVSGDRVAAESFLQHAEHYTRMLGEAQRQNQDTRPGERDDREDRDDARDEDVRFHGDRQSGERQNNERQNSERQNNERSGGDQRQERQLHERQDRQGGERDGSGSQKRPRGDRPRRQPQQPAAEPSGLTTLDGGGEAGGPVETPEAAGWMRQDVEIPQNPSAAAEMPHQPVSDDQTTESAPAAKALQPATTELAPDQPRAPRGEELEQQQAGADVPPDPEGAAPEPEKVKKPRARRKPKAAPAPASEEAAAGDND